MDLPFDVKELISFHLCGHDLVNMCGLDPVFKVFFKKKVSPIFRDEFIRISKIIRPLKRLLNVNPCIYFTECEIVSYVLDREVEKDEFFDDEVEYHIWKTTKEYIYNEYENMDLYTLIEIYNSEVSATIQYKNDFLEEYYHKNHMDFTSYLNMCVSWP